MDRIAELCAYIDACDTFADVGCDHGYCTQYALERGLCRRAIIADVSAKSLSKAEKLLSGHIASGAVLSVCCDGLDDIPEDTEQVLIAGMGGEEIIKILTRGFIPRKFIFQPMKNAPLLRRYLISRGCNITRDDVFGDDKFYFVTKGTRQGAAPDYDELEYAFGRDSLKNPAFARYAATELNKKLSYLGGCDEGSDSSSLRREIALLKGAIERYERKTNS